MVNSAIKISVIIVNWNTKDMLADCIDSIEQHAGDLDLEIIVVDNASSDGSPAMIRERYPEVHLIANQENVGFARANNQAMEIAQGDFFLLWNSDAFALPNSIQILLELALEQPRAGLIGAQLRNVDGTFQASHTPFPNLWREFLILSSIGRKLYGRYPSHGPEDELGPQIVDYVEGACMFVRRQAYEEVGGLDEGYFMYAEEVDWCYAMQKNGWQVWYQPRSKVTHLGGASSATRRARREADMYQSRVRFFYKYYGDWHAILLKLLIYSLTVIKIGVHGTLRFVTNNRMGRPVTTLRNLHEKLNSIPVIHRVPNPQNDSRKNVLLLTQVLPYPPDSGPKIKTWNVLKYLIQYHDVTLVSFVRGDQSVEINHLKEYCQAVYTIPIDRGVFRDIWYMLLSFLTNQSFLMIRDDRATMRHLIDQLVAQEQFDVVHADQLNMCQYAARVPQAYKVLDAHNALWLLYKRLADTMSFGPKKLLLNRDWRLLKKYEGKLCRDFEAVLTVSQEDRVALEEAAGKPLDTITIPIAIDTDEVAMVNRRPQANHILHIGTMYWPPNIDGILWFIQEIYPHIIKVRPDVTFDIVGSRPPQTILDYNGQKGINVTGYVEDPTDYYEQAALMVVPLRAGGGMRVKILNALSQGIPMVSTTLGAEGIAVESGKHILIADQPVEFAEAVLRLLDKRQFADELSRNGRQLAETLYDYRAACRPLDEIYGRVNQKV